MININYSIFLLKIFVHKKNLTDFQKKLGYMI